MPVSRPPSRTRRRRRPRPPQGRAGPGGPGPLDETNLRDACLALTQDAHAFVAVDSAGYVGPSILCFTEENKTPFLLMGSSGVPQEYYPRSHGLLFSIFQGSTRGMQNLAWEV